MQVNGSYFDRNVGKDEVGTTVLEIGVLTGFVPVHKSFEKVCQKMLLCLE